MKSPRLGLNSDGARVELPEVGLLGTGLHPFSQSECVDFVLDELDHGRGGWVIASTLEHIVNVGRDEDFRAVYEDADVRVTSDTVLAWACRLQRTPLPERVPSSDLLEELASEAVGAGRSVFVIAESEECAEQSALRLHERNPGLELVGTAIATPGTERDPLGVARLVRSITESRPDLVFVGIATPSQEHLIRALRAETPTAWWIAAGDGLRVVSGHTRAAPDWMQRSGLEWIYRLVREPKRLFRRYVIEGVPQAVALLTRCAFRGTLPTSKQSGPYGRRMPRALLVDDDRNALNHLELLLSTRFPDLEIETRIAPDASGVFDFYFIDNDFDGQHLAAELASGIRSERPQATIIAFSGVLDVDILKELINLGCDGVCDKEEPSSWRPVLELIDRRLIEMEERRSAEHIAFGGVRRSAHSIERLLNDWNVRDAERKEKAKA